MMLLLALAAIGVPAYAISAFTAANFVYFLLVLRCLPLIDPASASPKTSLNVSQPNAGNASE